MNTGDEKQTMGEMMDESFILSQFEDPEFRERVFRKAMKGREISLPELLLYSLSASVLGGATTGAPYPEDGSVGRTRESDWVSSAGVVDAGLNESERAKMWRQSRDLTIRDGMLGTLVRRMVIHVCGRGPWLSVVAADKDDAVAVGRAKMLEERRKRILVNFPQIARLLVTQTFINGTIPVLHLPVESMTGVRSQLRPVWPEHLARIHLDDTWSLMPVVSGYEFPVLKGIVARGVLTPACCTLSRVHHEMNDGVWGLSVPYQLLAELMRYIDWLEQRRFKARADNISIILRYLKSTETLKKREIPDRPMVIDAKMDDEKWDILNLASGSSRDATGGDGGEFRMRLSAVSGWPEHFLTGNAQFAAQMGKDAFPTALLEYYQECFTGVLLEVAAKTLGASRAELRVLWPPVDMRDRPARVSECSTLLKDRAISRAELHRQLGYDHELIEAELAAELQAELAAGPSGNAAGFGGMGVGGLGLEALTGAPTEGAAQSPLAGPTPSPAATPAVAPAAKPPAASSGGTTVTLPSALASDTSFAARLQQMGGESPLGLTTEAITSGIPKLSVVAIGADYGFAAEGAAIVGGLMEDGSIAVVGELTFKRVPSSGWAEAFDGVKAQYPSLEHVFTGSDEPELTETLNQHGYKAVAKHLGEDRTAELVRGSGRKITVNEQCVELLSDLFPEQADRIAGRHTTKGRHDHRDAFRYLYIGLLELAGQVGKI